MEVKLDRVHKVLPAVAGRADEIERTHRLPDDLVATLAAAGCFRMSRINTG